MNKEYHIVYTIGKTFIYLVISTLVAIMIHYSDAKFFDSFINGLIPLLATLTAIYMTANSLVFIELNRIKEKYKSADIKSTINDIKLIFTVQIIMILFLTFAFILKDFLLGLEWDSQLVYGIIKITSNSIALAVFGYFLEAIYDTGCILFMFIDFNNKPEDNED